LDAALDFTEVASYAYTPEHFIDEIKGICDGMSFLSFPDFAVKPIFV